MVRFLERIAERKIQEAMERGEFDDLALAGKPLSLESDRLVPEDLRLGYKVLKDAGFLPPEMELRKEILTLKELLSTIDSDEERLGLARRINHLVLRLNLQTKRSIDREERQVYARKIAEKLSSR